MIYGDPYVLGFWGILALFAGSMLAGRSRPLTARATELLNTRVAVLVLMGVSGLWYGLLWGGLNHVPIVHDEVSYVLQAETFARARWALPAPPMAQFFEQFHVLVDPVLASKYPPGHGILLAPGALIGLIGLMPLILSACTGGLIFALVRRIANPWPALLAWFLWLVAPANLAYRASYFSEVTTGCLMLCAWWQLLNWRKSGERKSLLLIAAAIGWSAITRPLSALAFALPIGVYVLWRCFKRSSWKQLGAAIALGALILLLLPWQSMAITGDWALTPYRHYSEVYFPFDIPGFDKPLTQSLRELPRDMQRFRELYLPYHDAHTLASLPSILLERVKLILHTTWGSWWPLFAPLFLLAGLRFSREALFALASAVLLILAYLLFAHPAQWVLYYMEAQEILFMLTALGAWQAIRGVMNFARRGESIPQEEFSSRAGLAITVVILTMLPATLLHFAEVHERHESRRAAQTEFEGMLSALPEKSVVFVRYETDHDIHTSLIRNVPDMDAAHAWTAYDRGSQNIELMLYAEGRTPYIFEERIPKMHPMNPLTGGIQR